MVPSSDASHGNDATEQDTHLFAQKQHIERLGRIRQLVFGSLDGLLVPLGVISRVAGGTGSTRAVLVAGLAEAFAGVLSMGAGEFIAARSEAQVQQAQVAKELEELRRHPDSEQDEMIALLVVVGLIKGKLTSLNPVRSVLEIVIVGGASAGGGYLLGTTIPHLLGF